MVIVFSDASNLSARVLRELEASRLDFSIEATPLRRFSRSDAALAIVVRSVVDEVEVSELQASAARSPSVRWALVAQLSTTAVRSITAQWPISIDVFWHDETQRLADYLARAAPRSLVQAFAAAHQASPDLSSPLRAALAEIASSRPTPKTVEGLAARIGHSSRTLRRHWKRDVSGNSSIKVLLDLHLLEQWLAVTRRISGHHAARQLGVDIRTIQRVCRRVAGGRPTEVREAADDVIAAALPRIDSG